MHISSLTDKDEASQNPPSVPTFGELRSSRFTKGEALEPSDLPLFGKEGRGRFALFGLMFRFHISRVRRPCLGMKDCDDINKPCFAGFPH
jgi:hypothetical protein